MQTGGYIYAIGVVGTSYVKIGSTRMAVEKRLQSLQTGQPFPLQVLASISVSRDLRRIEKQVHTFLTDASTHGEWFDTPLDAVRLEALVVQASQWVAEQHERERRAQGGHLTTADRDIGQKIRNRREHLGMSQVELSKLIHISQGRISEWENGTRTEMSLKNLRSLARVLGLSADYLIGTWDEGMPAESPVSGVETLHSQPPARGRGRPRRRPQPQPMAVP